jgi:hypothetical protein
MNSTNGFRRTKGDFLRAAAGAAVLIAAAISTAALWAIALSDSGAPSASSPQPTTAGTSVSLASLALTVGGVLVAVMAVVLTVGYGRRRIARRRIARRRAGRRRGGMHAQTPGPRPDGATNTVTDPVPLNRLSDTGGYWSTGNPGLGPPDLPAPAARPPKPEDEYPSWPGPPGPYALHPDHPSWPGRRDPRWAATEAILREDDYPSWPERQSPPWPDAAPPILENSDRNSPGDRSDAPQEPSSAPSRSAWDASGTPGVGPAGTGAA